MRQQTPTNLELAINLCRSYDNLQIQINYKNFLRQNLPRQKSNNNFRHPNSHTNSNNSHFNHNPQFHTRPNTYQARPSFPRNSTGFQPRQPIFNQPVRPYNPRTNVFAPNPNYNPSNKPTPMSGVSTINHNKTPQMHHNHFQNRNNSTRQNPNFTVQELFNCEEENLNDAFSSGQDNFLESTLPEENSSG